MKYLDNQNLIYLCMCLASLRIYLEVTGFNFQKLPITAKMGQNGEKVHRVGLYLSVGYIILFAPNVLLS